MYSQALAKIFLFRFNTKVIHYYKYYDEIQNSTKEILLCNLVSIFAGFEQFKTTTSTTATTIAATTTTPIPLGVTKTDQVTISTTDRNNVSQVIHPPKDKAIAVAQMIQDNSLNLVDTSVNLCSTGKNLCKDELHTECVLKKNSYECVCIMGFEKGDGAECSGKQLLTTAIKIRSHLTCQ